MKNIWFFFLAFCLFSCVKPVDPAKVEQAAPVEEKKEAEAPPLEESGNYMLVYNCKETKVTDENTAIILINTREVEAVGLVFEKYSTNAKERIWIRIKSGVLFELPIQRNKAFYQWYIHNFPKAYYAQQEDMLKTFGEWKYTIDNPEPGAKDL
ncbi:MAG: hypothetical protein MdMp024_0336 [Bacteroidales bacterium]